MVLLPIVLTSRKTTWERSKISCSTRPKPSIITCMGTHSSSTRHVVIMTHYYQAAWSMVWTSQTTIHPLFATHPCKTTKFTTIYRMPSSPQFQTVLACSLQARPMKLREWAPPSSRQETASARKCRVIWVCSQLPRPLLVLSIEEICDSCSIYCSSRMSRMNKMRVRMDLLKLIAHLMILKALMRF